LMSRRVDAHDRLRERNPALCRVLFGIAEFLN
jgi:hypothetical protein